MRRKRGQWTKLTFPHCLHYNHGVSVRTLQKQFFMLLAAIVIMCLLLELRLLPLQSESDHAPKAIKPRLFVTCECGYDRRLGNTMFSFAAAIGIAKLNNMSAVVERISPLVDTFHIVEPISADMDNTMAYKSVDYLEYGRRGSAYDRGTRNLFQVINSKPNHVRLIGYYQSWRYFDNVADRVRHNFVFREHISTKAKSYLSSVEPAEWKTSNSGYTRVGIHVRRGDMIDQRLRDYGYTVATRDYFQSATRYFAERYQNVQFVVCSDNVKWCHDNLPAAADIGVNIDMVFSENKSPEVDLAILANCHHVIMSVGSFGWWAAWLANGTTIYYADWPRPYSKLEYHVNKDDYFPKHWIPMR